MSRFILVVAYVAAFALAGCAGPSTSIDPSDSSKTGNNTDNPTNTPLASPTTEMFTLTVNKVGNGTLVGSGINCGSVCSVSLPAGTTVSLTATAGSSYVFSNWGGDCTGSSVCTVTMNANASVSAVFTFADTQSPTIPTNLVALAGSSTSINLTWTQSSDNVGVQGYKIFRGSETQAFATTSSTSYTVTGLLANTTYTYSVAAFDAAGNISAKATASATTSEANVSMVTLFVAKNGTGTGSVSGGGINCGSVCSVSVNQGTSITLMATANANSAFSGWGGDCAGTGPCTLTMSANKSVVANFAFVDQQAPSAPTNLTATGISSSSIQLNWNASSDNVGVQGYKIFRGSETQAFATSSSASYTVTGLSSNTTYTYSVAAFDAAGNVSTKSASTSATTLPQVGLTNNCPSSAAKLWAPHLIDYGSSDYSGIKTIACYGDSLYVGGLFDYVGASTGPLGKIAIQGSGAVTSSSFIGLKGTSVSSLVSDGAGGWFAAGSFDGGQNLVHILSDNSVDPNWKPSINGVILMTYSENYLYVYRSTGELMRLSSTTGAVDARWSPGATGISINAMQIYGQYLYIAGSGGLTRIQNLSDGTARLDTNWKNTLLGGTAYALSVISDGRLYVGGYFGGSLKRVTTNDSGQIVLDSTFNISITGFVLGLQQGADGKLYVGGQFTSAGGQPRGNLLRISLSSTGVPSIDAWNASTNGQVDTLLTQGNSVYIGGSFSTVNGETRNNIARISFDGVLDSWNPNASGSVESMAIWGGDVLLGGRFQMLGERLVRHNIAKFSLSTGEPDRNWNPIPNGVNFFGDRVIRMSLTADGRYLYVYSSGFSNSGEKLGLALVSSSGSGNLVAGWSSGISGAIGTMETYGNKLYVTTQADLKIYEIPLEGGATQIKTTYLPAVLAVSGNELFYVEGYPYTLRRMNLDTRIVNPVWSISSTASISSVAVRGDDVYVATTTSPTDGYLNKYSTLPNGTPVLKWSTNVKSLQKYALWQIWAIAVSDTDVFAGGLFDSVSGLSRKGLAKFSTSTGAVDAQWDTYPTSGAQYPWTQAIILSASGDTVYTADVNGVGLFSTR